MTPEAPPSPAHPVAARSRRRRLLRVFEQTLAIAALALILWLILPFQKWIYRGMDRQTELQHADYIICLGGGADRVIESAKLMQEGWADTLILSCVGIAATDMRNMAIEWGVPADRILVDRTSHKTRHHPQGVKRLGVDPANDTCIIVTGYTHMPRSKACFEKAGFRRLILREPRWERELRDEPDWRYGWRARIETFPALLYEGAAWVEYWIRGAI